MYETIEARYGADSSPGVCEVVAKAMLNKGVETGKLHGPEKAIAVYEAIEARYGADRSPGVRCKGHAQRG
ncbi:MAG: hypothetical protein IPJ18_19165 [Betaproteobacteria bacterium]|nr:hypothetical protein [Betaproteobacteria bacterium]